MSTSLIKPIPTNDFVTKPLLTPVKDVNRQSNINTEQGSEAVNQQNTLSANFYKYLDQISDEAASVKLQQSSIKLQIDQEEDEQLRILSEFKPDQSQLNH